MLEDALAKRTRHVQNVFDVTEDRSEEYPVVVIDAYMVKYRENRELWETLIKFATQLVKRKIAQVIFVSSNIGITDRIKIQGKFTISLNFNLLFNQKYIYIYSYSSFDGN